MIQKKGGIMEKPLTHEEINSMDARLVRIKRMLDELPPLPWEAQVVWRKNIPMYHIKKPGSPVVYMIFAEPCRKTDLNFLLNAPQDMQYLYDQYMKICGGKIPTIADVTNLKIEELTKKLKIAVSILTDISAMENLEHPEIELPKLIIMCQEAINELQK